MRDIPKFACFLFVLILTIVLGMACTQLAMS